METVTFYSYKGGVGRSLALANIALYLSRFGFNVCLMDLDLEAPGLHYKFHVKTSDIKKGLLDLIYSYAHDEGTSFSMEELSIKIPNAPGAGGEIRLLPAGNILSPRYWDKLSLLDWRDLLYRSEGIPFFLNLKEEIRSALKPDFLLIDSRTGVTESSGLCTALLPDKVVCILVNNQENREGARQVLKAIRSAERPPGQKQIDLVLALARIPFSSDEEGKVIENDIVADIRDFLNESSEDLMSQLDIQDICVLYSDRALELLEGLRLDKKELDMEMPLLRGYLKLFSAIVPDEIISTKLDDILSEIISDRNMLKTPNLAQRNLEAFAGLYKYPKSFERLIEFYLLRNVERDKTLKVFHDLWKTFGFASPEILRGYVRLFMKGSLGEPEKEITKTITVPSKLYFNLELVEGARRIGIANDSDVAIRLAEAYERYGRAEDSEALYQYLIDEAEDEKGKKEIISKLLNKFVDRSSYEKAAALIDEYTDIIDNDMPLRITKIKFKLQMGEKETVTEMFDDNGATESYFFSSEPVLCYRMLQILELEERADNLLKTALNNAVLNSNKGLEELSGIGSVFYALGKRDDFVEEVRARFPQPGLGITQMLGNLERRRKE